MTHCLLPALLVLAPSTISVRVEGEGYLRFLREGRAVYARKADLVVEKGELREKSGPGFLPPIRIASGASFAIAADGAVTVNGGKFPAGRLYLARFAANAALEPLGSFFLARDRAELGYPGDPGWGTVVLAGNSLIEARPAGASPTQAARKPEAAGPAPQRPAAGTLRVSIPETVEVEGPSFTLGEIAKIEGPEAERLRNLNLGNAPVHGIPMLFARERVLAKITLLGIDRKLIDLEMPPNAQIRRRGQTVSADDLLAAAKKAVEDKFCLKGDLDTLDRLSPIAVPNGKVEVLVESANLSGGTASISLGIRIDGRRFAGRTVRLSGPSLEPAVAPGGQVTVRFVSNGLSVELPGRAKSAGAIGQIIDVAVTIPETRETTTHQGTVIAAGIVEVRA